MNENLKIQKIERQYVGEDCIQIMFPFNKAMTILSQDGILFHQKKYSELYINNYLQDERRKRFPYSNIPVHDARIGMKVMTYVNQLLEYEKPYLKISDGSIIEKYVLKSKNDTLLISSSMPIDKRIEYMTYDEFMNFISRSKTLAEPTYYVFLDGSINLNSFNDLNEVIYNYIQTRLTDNISAFREYQKIHTDYISDYLKTNPWFLNYLEASLKNLDLSLMDFNLGIFKDSSLLIIRIKDNNIKITGVEATFVRNDNFKVEIYDIPVVKYVFDQIKNLPKISITKEPNIPLSLNPNVTKKDILEAKQMVRTLKKY